MSRPTARLAAALVLAAAAACTAPATAPSPASVIGRGARLDAAPTDTTRAPRDTTGGATTNGTHVNPNI